MSTAAPAALWPLTGRHDDMELFAQLLVDPSFDGVVLHGAPGVGKTRLAHEWTTMAEHDGHRVHRAVASRTAATVPLGAIAHLLPREVTDERGGGGRPTDLTGPIELFDHAASALRTEDGRRSVLLVDDLHLLDATSITLISQFLAAGVVLLVGTVREGEPLPDGVDAMWRGGRVRRHDLGDLPDPAIDTLLHLALGGPLDGEASAALRESSEGNVLFLRELVLGARHAGTLVEDSGVWRLAGRLAPTGRLVELVEARISDVDPHGRAALDLLALCGPIGLTELERVVATDALGRLERDGLIDVRNDGRRCLVALGHPLHGEALRSGLTRITSRRILLDQVERTAAHGARRREDDLRVATWRLDATGRADPDLLERAGRQARAAHDFEQVERLARAARQERPTPRNALLLGEALYETGAFSEADAVLAAGLEALGPADETSLAVQLSQKRSTNLFWGLLRADQARDVMRDARSAAATTAARNELLAAEASTVMYGGDPVTALDLIASLEAGGGSRTDVLRAIVEGPALAVTGRTADALTVARQGLENHIGLGEQLAIAHPGTHVVAQVLALTEAGQLVEASDLAEAGYDRAVADRVPIARVWFALNLGRALLVQGRLADSLRWFREGAVVARSTGFAGPLRIALNGVACASGMAGDSSTARIATAELDRLPGALGFLNAEEALGRTWSAVADGRPREGRELLSAAADEAAHTGHLTSEAWLLHDLARLGEASGVATRLEQLAELSDSALVAARARHAGGASRQDGVELDAVTDDFESMGALLLAAEAAASAADAHRRSGRVREATNASARSAALAARCQGASTPGLVCTSAVVPLSSREREICVLASQGLASKVIAERLFLSSRTVNNHLQSAYSKLGISRREELARVLHVEEPPT